MDPRSRSLRDSRTNRPSGEPTAIKPPIDNIRYDLDRTEKLFDEVRDRRPALYIRTRRRWPRQTQASSQISPSPRVSPSAFLSLARAKVLIAKDSTFEVVLVIRFGCPADFSLQNIVRS
ncbi:uncharacterized protein LOC122036649 isoform X1 [Zingiber officinale]|uniref:uncharacterized protein LOC122036649 isoform X1 n=1 Tax=Zingiber officinale TaxID=94328 RepID=UPI001C4C3934|nr:uncharacterized protein LOC122036649 isoform X1 [Zingiber officinale]